MLGVLSGDKVKGAKVTLTQARNSSYYYLKIDVPKKYKDDLPKGLKEFTEARGVMLRAINIIELMANIKLAGKFGRERKADGFKFESHFIDNIAYSLWYDLKFRLPS